MSKQVLKTSKRLPNMQCNSSWVIGVSVDLDKKESVGTVRGRTNQQENGIASPGKCHREAAHPMFYCAGPFSEGDLKVKKVDGDQSLSEYDSKQ